MAEDKVTIEVDGKSYEARKGQMLMQVTDAQGIYVPRFCYHKKLAVAANCRMCLVEVEKAPKPLPACATPVMDGMVVRTKSKLAIEAQKSVMEFLLINHPLDCPICDQGGECELQDLSMGYGSDISRYQEKKRVVKDKNIGPLVQTDMTRCIQCTRCVRFGEEIAGLKELGATGRGEHMEIGTYIEKSMVSELSGNVIDLCPVGALTSKPFRYSARAWEITQHPGIAPHDSLGSNLHFHVKVDRVKRVVPAENEAVNEVWLSDRDRFSYEGMYSEDRLREPMLKVNGEWEEVDWETAFQHARQSLRGVIDENGAGAVGALASPTATTEELFLLQKFLRGLGSGNIDHRLRRSDFSDQDNDPVFPWLGQSVHELEDLQAALIIGGNPRKDQPLLNLRLRKAALKGADIMFVNPLAWDLNYRVSAQIVSREPARALAGILRALQEMAGGGDDDARALLQDVEVTEPHRDVARKLHAGGRAAVLVGSLAASMPDYSAIRYLAGKIAELSGAVLGFPGEAANSAGACLAGALPHRGPAGREADPAGLDAQSMLRAELPAYVLLNVEPELDCCNGRLARETLEKARTVVAITPYRTPAMEKYADVLLPMAVYAENEGSYYNLEGTRQAFSAVVPAPGEARPAWKVLRVLATEMGVDGCRYDSVDAIGAELDSLVSDIRPDNQRSWRRPAAFPAANGAVRLVTDVPLYAGDGLQRRAAALQKTGQGSDGRVHLNAELAQRLDLGEEGKIRLQQEEVEVVLPFVLDAHVPENTVLVHAAQPAAVDLGEAFVDVNVSKG
jgi:NADH-quinone oxidoreductase subunit G